MGSLYDKNRPLLVARRPSLVARVRRALSPQLRSPVRVPISRRVDEHEEND
jgi:hypothetical protein